MSQCNGLKLTPLNQDCNRIAVKSSVATSWQMTFKSRAKGALQSQEVGFDKDELLVISFQDGSGNAELEIEPLGDKAGTIIMQDSRGPTLVMRVGKRYKHVFPPGASLVFRSRRIVYPNNMGAGIAV